MTVFILTYVLLTQVQPTQTNVSAYAAAFESEHLCEKSKKELIRTFEKNAKGSQWMVRCIEAEVKPDPKKT